MKKGNVLFIGNSGVGKTTLINTIMNENAETGFGIAGTTKQLKVYENSEVSFRIIDTIGFEPSAIFRRNEAVGEVKKWSKEAAEKAADDKDINLICLCVDGTSSKLFPKTIKDFLKAISMWKNVPILVAVTKSYSEPDKELNVKMVTDAFEGQNANLKDIIPVVAAPYVISDDIVVPPSGIEVLIERINELLPEGIQAAQMDVESYILNRKRFMAHSTVTSMTVAGVGVGLVPIPFSDAMILAPIEMAEINHISKIYGLIAKDGYKQYLNTLIDAGTVSVAAKAVISGLKAIPGINLAASVLNGVIAGVFVFGIGEATVYIDEQIYLGKKSIDDVDWIKKVVENKLTSDILSKATVVLAELPEKPTRDDIFKAVQKIIAK